MCNTAKIHAHLDPATGVWTFSFSGIPPLSELEAAMIRAALGAQRGNKASTAKLLGIDRRTLYRKCREYGIHVAREVHSA